jgi:hypothetical protein
MEHLNQTFAQLSIRQLKFICSYAAPLWRILKGD